MKKEHVFLRSWLFVFAMPCFCLRSSRRAIVQDQQILTIGEHSWAELCLSNLGSRLVYWFLRLVQAVQGFCLDVSHPRCRCQCCASSLALLCPWRKSIERQRCYRKIAGAPPFPGRAFGFSKPTQHKFPRRPLLMEFGANWPMVGSLGLLTGFRFP